MAPREGARLGGKIPEGRTARLENRRSCRGSAGVEPDVAEMIANRVIDNAAVAIAAINRRPAVSARAMALAHPRKIGGTIFGSRVRADLFTGMGRLGQRHCGPRTGHARHVPRR